MNLCAAEFHHFIILILLNGFHKFERSRGLNSSDLEALFGGKPRPGLASMNLGKIEDGFSTAEQLLEVLGDNNDEEEVEVTFGGRLRHIR